MRSEHQSLRLSGAVDITKRHQKEVPGRVRKQSIFAFKGSRSKLGTTN